MTLCIIGYIHSEVTRFTEENSTLRNAPDWLNLTTSVSYSFTMVEENFEIRLSETPKNGSILPLFCHSHTFTMVEENIEI